MGRKGLQLDRGELAAQKVRGGGFREILVWGGAFRKGRALSVLNFSFFTCHLLPPLSLTYSLS